MRTVRRNTIQVAEDIPESQYGFRPTAESRSVSELLVHIAWLASADRLLHEEHHIDTVAGFDFGVLLLDAEGGSVAQSRRSMPSFVGTLPQTLRAGLQGQGQTVGLFELDGYSASDIQTYAQCFGGGGGAWWHPQFWSCECDW